MKLELRELRDNVTFLRNVALVNSTNEIGKHLSIVLDFVDAKIVEEQLKDIIETPASKTGRTDAPTKASPAD